MGRPTADSASQYTDHAFDFIGTGNPDQVAAQLQSSIVNATILFVKAKYSKSSIEKKTTSRQQIPLIVYDNSLVENMPPIPDVDIAVLTSPLSAQAYLDVYGIPTNATILTIGPTTAASIQDKVSNIKIAKTPTESALAVALHDIIVSFTS